MNDLGPLLDYGWLPSGHLFCHITAVVCVVAVFWFVLDFFLILPPSLSSFTTNSAIGPKRSFVAVPSNIKGTEMSDRQPSRKNRDMTDSPTLRHRLNNTIVSNGKDGSAGSMNLPPATVVYHESARSIVFRDYLRRQQAIEKGEGTRYRSRSGSPEPIPATTTIPGGGGDFLISTDASVSSPARTNSSRLPSTTILAGYTPEIEPLPMLELGQGDVFTPLIEQSTEEDSLHLQKLSDRERLVVKLLRDESAVAKTVRNADWTSFLDRFRVSNSNNNSNGLVDGATNSSCSSVVSGEAFKTSTTLLPSMGKKMRCYGSIREFTVGAIFALPPTDSFNDSLHEDDAFAAADGWAWPSGYSAKTEFNIDSQGRLINGREEALVSISTLRKHNHVYLHDTDYIVGGHLVKGGLTTVPYNEIFVKAGGCEMPSVEAKRVISDGGADSPYLPMNRSFEGGIGPPIALFVRAPTFGQLVALLRTRARTVAMLGKDDFGDIPLLIITPEDGVRILTTDLQSNLFRILAQNLNPFQNSLLLNKTTVDIISEKHMRQKLEELIDLNDNGIRTQLTREECARIAGGFGATDESVAQLLMDAMRDDQIYQKTQSGSGGPEENEQEKGNAEKSDNGLHTGQELQHLVNEGLVSAVRAADYNTARQLLILYTLVATRGSRENSTDEQTSNRTDTVPRTSLGTGNASKQDFDEENTPDRKTIFLRKNSFDSNSGRKEDTTDISLRQPDNVMLGYPSALPPPPPPPPLDTDRLRHATNSDGLLAVLGAAEVLKSIQNGGAKQRLMESVNAVEEWVMNGERSVAYRLQSWRDQRLAQGDLKIAMARDANFTAFFGSRAITNRKKFSGHLRRAAENIDVESVSFLQAIHEVVTQMRSPCLRLELLQYIFGLDNRYSVAHAARSIELAATCLNISKEGIEPSSVEDKKITAL